MLDENETSTTLFGLGMLTVGKCLVVAVKDLFMRFHMLPDSLVLPFTLYLSGQIAFSTSSFSCLHRFKDVCRLTTTEDEHREFWTSFRLQ